MQKTALAAGVIAAALVLWPTAASAAVWTADDQDPDANGCAYVDDLTRLNEVPIDGSVGGYVQQLQSPTCGVVYTRLVMTKPDPSLEVELEVDRWGTAGTFTTHKSADGTAFWSNEMGAQPGQDCVHSTAWIFDGTSALVGTASMSYSCPASY
jgi:hypothetical protein